MEEKVPNGIWQACRKLMIASFIALVVVIAVAFLLLPFARFMSFETIEVIRKTFEWSGLTLLAIFMIASGVWASNLKDHIHWVDKDEESK